jgi:hypothetical protein
LREDRGRRYQRDSQDGHGNGSGNAGMFPHGCTSLDEDRKETSQAWRPVAH